MVMDYAFAANYSKNPHEDLVSDTMDFLLTVNWQCNGTDKYISHLV